MPTLELEFIDTRFTDLFDFLPDIYFFVKNKKYEIIMANKSNINLLGYKNMSEVYGKTVFDIFPKKIAENMHKDDMSIIELGETIMNKVELVVNINGGINWFSTTKIPIIENNEIVGIKGITRNIGDATGVTHIYSEFHPIIEYIHSNLDKVITTEELSNIACLSCSQFRRRFKSLFKTSPKSFIASLKIQKACELLAHRDLNVREVAERCGFKSQSFFSKQFKAIVGVTPMQYKITYSRLEI